MIDVSATSTGFDVAPLGNDADAERVAQWIYEEWGSHEAGVTLGQLREVVRGSRTSQAPIPRFFAGHRDGTLLGCASIVASDLPLRSELGPWLANVYVTPPSRRQGLARMLIRAVMDYARGLTDTLYLYTPDQVELYRRLGWSEFARERYLGRAIVVMRWDPPGRPRP
jgi:GNAT superfamily N-acetyltransferase